MTLNFLFKIIFFSWRIGEWLKLSIVLFFYKDYMVPLALYILCRKKVIVNQCEGFA